MNEKQLLELLTSKTFENWYKGKFDDYISGEMERGEEGGYGVPTQDQILADLRGFIQKYKNFKA